LVLLEKQLAMIEHLKARLMEASNLDERDAEVIMAGRAKKELLAAIDSGTKTMIDMDVIDA
jgi:hypothetical protein